VIKRKQTAEKTNLKVNTPSMKRTSVQHLFTLVFIMTLTACAATSTKTALSKPAQTLGLVEQQVTDLLKQASKTTHQNNIITRISHCRYELNNLWSNAQKGLYEAQNKMRFSFTHDVRDIAHIPEHIVRYKDNSQRWQERIELSFNRYLPSSFRHVSTNDYQTQLDHSIKNRWTIRGYTVVPLNTMEQLVEGLRTMARLCGNDLNEIKQIEHKVVGRWAVDGLGENSGTLIITPNTATLKHQDGASVTGPYTIANEDSHYVISINPSNASNRYNLQLSFVTSNYARLRLLENDGVPIAFEQPTLDDTDSRSDPNELKLLRMGDLR
jgi:hypothetical protein